MKSVVKVKRAVHLERDHDPVDEGDSTKRMIQSKKVIQLIVATLLLWKAE